MLAVQALCENSRCGGFPDTPGTCKQICVNNPITLDCIYECTFYMVLVEQFFKGLRPVAKRKGSGFGHLIIAYFSAVRHLRSGPRGLQGSADSNQALPAPQSLPCTVASFRTWRGWRGAASQDPIFIVYSLEQGFPLSRPHGVLQPRIWRISSKGDRQPPA